MMKREILYEGKFKRLIKQDGWEFIERVNSSGVVAVIARTDDDRVIFVEQFRVPVGKNVIEFTAGLAGDLLHAPEESLEEAARRELLEEAGYEAARMECIAEGPVNSSSSTDILVLFLATGVRKVHGGGGDHTENIIVHEIPFKETHAWLERKKQEGCLICPKVYAGLYWLSRHR